MFTSFFFHILQRKTQPVFSPARKFRSHHHLVYFQATFKEFASNVPSLAIKYAAQNMNLWHFSRVFFPFPPPSPLHGLQRPFQLRVKSPRKKKKQPGKAQLRYFLLTVLCVTPKASVFRDLGEFWVGFERNSLHAVSASFAHSFHRHIHHFQVAGLCLCSWCVKVNTTT